MKILKNCTKKARKIMHFKMGNGHMTWIFEIFDQFCKIKDPYYVNGTYKIHIQIRVKKRN